MSKLLSHGYVEEQKKSPNDDDASSTTQGIGYGFIKMQSTVGCSSLSVRSSLGAEIMSPFSIFFTHMRSSESPGADGCHVLQVWPQNRPAPSQRRTWTIWSRARQVLVRRPKRFLGGGGEGGVELVSSQRLFHGVTNPRTRHSAPHRFTHIYCTSTDS